MLGNQAHVGGDLRVHDGARARSIAAAGVVSGALGGTVMALFLVVVGGWRDVGAFTVLRAMSALFRHEGAVPGSTGALLLGLAVHGAVSVALGVLYAAIVKRDAAPLAAVLGGLVLAVAVCVLMTAVVLPVVDPTLRAIALHGMPTAWLGAHVAYGLCLGWAPQLLSRASAARA